MASSSKHNDTFLYIAKLAEEAERYDEMVDSMKNGRNLDEELTIEEQSLLSVGEGDCYRCLGGSKGGDEMKELEDQLLMAHQPGPRDNLQQCYVRRNKKTSTFYLYLALTPSNTDMGQFLLAARRYRYATHTKYIISLDAADLSEGSNAYVGKLRADFFGTNFTIYESQPSDDHRVNLSSSKTSLCFTSKQISPQVPTINFEIGQVSYKLNALVSCPRRLICSLKSPRIENSPSNYKHFDKSDTKKLESSLIGYTIFHNKAPKMNEQLKCWCLDFNKRVTVPSVKNFQLVATVNQSELEVKEYEEVILQFGKVGDNIFTMDYRHPLSAFQAFAICLTSFGGKPGR